MPVEPLEVQPSGTEAKDPASHRPRGDSPTLGDARHRRATSNHLGDRVENHLDAGHLPRQRVPGQDPLSMPAVRAARQGDAQRDERLRGLQPARHTAAGERDAGAATGRAAASGQTIVRGIGNERRVAARLDVEYEDHVLSNGPGVSPDFVRGRCVFSFSARVFVRHPMVWRTSRPTSQPSSGARAAGGSGRESQRARSTTACVHLPLA